MPKYIGYNFTGTANSSVVTSALNGGVTDYKYNSGIWSISDSSGEEYSVFTRIKQGNWLTTQRGEVVSPFLHVQLWGAGGGGSAGYTPYSGQTGGGGGFTEVKINNVNENDVFSFIVGSGGTDDAGPGALGGTFTGILEGNSPETPANHPKIVVAAGAGGGAGSYAGGPNISPSYASTPGYGGQGGSTTAGAGGDGLESGPGGGGGGQASGGAGGSGGTAAGSAGTTFTGGAGGNSPNQQGGDGGGGYYGGGGGGGSSNSGNGAGGGGGSNYVGGTPNYPVDSISNLGGLSGALPNISSSINSAGNGSPFYSPGIGIGGNRSGTAPPAGGAGQIKIIKEGSVVQTYSSTTVNVSVPVSWLS